MRLLAGLRRRPSRPRQPDAYADAFRRDLRRDIDAVDVREWERWSAVEAGAERSIFRSLGERRDT